MTLTSWCWIVQWSYNFVKGDLYVVRTGKHDRAVRLAGRGADGDARRLGEPGRRHPAGARGRPAAAGDLAQLDSAAPLRGPALVAVVDGAIWAARGLEDDRAIADPFRPSAEAAGLLALRVAQLRGAGTRAVAKPGRLRRRLAGRAGA